MRLSVVGAGPAYTDRPGATGAAYLFRLGGSSLLIDFTSRPFDAIELSRLRELVEQLVEHVPPVD